MKNEAILSILKGMELKHTRVICGRVVTRWAEDRFEVDTFNGNAVSSEEAADKLEL